MKPSLLLRAVLLLPAVTLAAEPIVEVTVPGEGGRPMPRFQLVGRLAHTILIEKCAEVSGLSCTVQLLPDQSIPSRIYSIAYGADGKALGPERRVLYPNLLPGERGRATLDVDQKSARIVLRGVWKGPWESPY